MKKLLRHKWIEQDGFRIHECKHCKLIRYWDDKFHRLMHKQRVNGVPMYRPTECKRIMHCDKILN